MVIDHLQDGKKEGDKYYLSAFNILFYLLNTSCPLRYH